MLSATPAALYAHVNDRKNVRAIFGQLLAPSFGDGVDLVIGDGVDDVMQAAGGTIEAAAAMARAGYAHHESLDELSPATRRAVVLLDGDFDLSAATARAIDILSLNPKGFFLMVESDLHTEQLVRGLERALALDRAIRQAAERMGDDTLILYTADHSYDVRVHDGRRGATLLPALDQSYGDDHDFIEFENVRRYDDHTGEEVIVAARGPGASEVHGVMSNVELFKIMRAAYGWR